jgi:methyltransferase-like protein
MQTSAAASVQHGSEKNVQDDPLSRDAEKRIARSYDEIAYESYPFRNSHPTLLATIGALSGMPVKPVSNCRVLEIGCASGGNLIPMAYGLPHSQFVGIDLSERQVVTGQKTIEDLGLTNIEIKHLSLMDIDTSFGAFDYIIAHGVYSWVPPEVQNKLLEICRTHLAENGIAYISYNTYPGWHFRGMIRDMMLYHTAQFEDPAKKAGQARYLMNFLSESVSSQSNDYALMLKTELGMISNSQDYYLIHEYLEDTNEPIYFYQFAEQADKHNLQYLGEAEVSSMLTQNFPQEVFFTLRLIANDVIRTEQYMDFLRNRMFRQTLLCHRDVKRNKDLDSSQILNLYISSAAKPLSQSDETQSTESDAFALPGRAAITPSNALIANALYHLAEVWPQSVPFPELLNAARSRLSCDSQSTNDEPDTHERALATELLDLYGGGIVTLRTAEASFVTQVSEKPTASALVRYQAQTTTAVTNQLHEPIKLSNFSQQLITLLDGSRNQQELFDELLERAEKGTLTVHKDGKPVTENQSLREVVGTALEQALGWSAKNALLIS